uniref:Uncharacterized protein n=1 Tax=Podoviridae sp. ct4s49 TaxID=2823555 RepID=A0A8S5LE59_9CAUD|nr:MAG TPA: hypothetical protein [Podoviridae sp. ct4s49]
MIGFTVIGYSSPSKACISATITATFSGSAGGV